MRSHGGPAPWFYLPIFLKPAQQLVLPFLPEQRGHLAVAQRMMKLHLKDCSAVTEVLLLSWVLLLISLTELAAGVFWTELDTKRKYSGPVVACADRLQHIDCTLPESDPSLLAWKAQCVVFGFSWSVL